VLAGVPSGGRTLISRGGRSFLLPPMHKFLKCAIILTKVYVKFIKDEKEDKDLA